MPDPGEMSELALRSGGVPPDLVEKWRAIRNKFDPAKLAVRAGVEIDEAHRTIGDLCFSARNFCARNPDEKTVFACSSLGKWKVWLVAQAGSVNLLLTAHDQSVSTVSGGSDA